MPCKLLPFPTHGSSCFVPSYLAYVDSHFTTQTMIPRRPTVFTPIPPTPAHACVFCLQAARRPLTFSVPASTLAVGETRSGALIAPLPPVDGKEHEGNGETWRTPHCPLHSGVSRGCSLLLIIIVFCGRTQRVRGAYRQRQPWSNDPCAHGTQL